jgi:hypothetical protein
MNMKKYKILPDKKFMFDFHDHNSQHSAFAVEGDIVECSGNQVYVTIGEQRIHTINYSWIVSKAVTDGTLEEIV